MYANVSTSYPSGMDVAIDIVWYVVVYVLISTSVLLQCFWH